MAGNDYELNRLRGEMDAAQREIDNASSRLDSINSKREGIKSQISSCKYRIADIKHSIDNEYQAMKICYQAHDHYSIQNHKYRAQSFKDALRREHEICDGYYSQLNSYKGEYESALAALRSAKDRKRRAREAFNARLEILKANNAMEKAKWKETTCKICGAKIAYHVEWKRIPDLCKPCLEKEKAKWHETTCRKCGKPTRYHEDWTHKPTICKNCKSGYMI